MIQANELRIGNLLNYETAEGDILSTTVDWQDMQWISENPDGFNLCHSPIAITKEWLLKFGLKKGIFYVLNLCEFDMLEFAFTDESLTLCIENTYADNAELIDLKHIKYIHQLQNLYFALTGKELEYQAGKHMKIYLDGECVAIADPTTIPFEWNKG